MRLSLSARLALIFSLIAILSLSAVGLILFSALSKQVYLQDDLSIVLAARHLRRLASELETTAGIREHQERLVSLVLGDPALALRIEAADGATLIDYNPPQIQMIDLHATPATERVVSEHVENWTSAGSVPVRGISTIATLREGPSVRISVARSMSDRTALLGGYRAVILGAVTSTALVAVALCYVLVRRALAPLRAIAASAHSITAERLDSRIDVTRAPLELHSLAEALNAMLRRLQAGFDRLWEFTADLAHDLRTPISNLRGASEVALTRDRSVGEYQALLASNIEECDRVSRMIENVLFLARAESPQFALHRVEFDAGDELQRIADYFEGIAAEQSLHVQVAGSARLMAERELFRRAVSNLLANALRHTSQGQTILMTAAQSDSGVTITVQNPGDHIPSDELGRLFDRFYRGDKARSNSGTSTGLGLAIVKTIVGIHGGSVSARSDGGLTCFELRFPA